MTKLSAYVYDVLGYTSTLVASNSTLVEAQFQNSICALRNTCGEGIKLLARNIYDAVSFLNGTIEANRYEGYPYEYNITDYCLSDRDVRVSATIDILNRSGSNGYNLNITDISVSSLCENFFYHYDNRTAINYYLDEFYDAYAAGCIASFNCILG